MPLLAVYTTVATAADARRIAQAMVERRLAACVQLTAIESFYAWQGAMQHEPEWRLMLKTTEAQYPALEAALRDLHPYELPAIHAVAVAQAWAPYADWVAAGSSGT